MKLHTYVSFPLVLNLTPFTAKPYKHYNADPIAESNAAPGPACAPSSLSSPSNDTAATLTVEHKYALVAVVVHHGTAWGGHYTTVSGSGIHSAHD